MNQINTIPQMPVAAPVAAPAALTAKAIRQRVQAIQEVMKEVMSEGQHYYSLGVRETKLSNGSTQKEPNFALSKSGAEVLCMTFQLVPEISSAFTEDRDAVIPWKSRRKEWYDGPRGREFRWVEEKGETEGYYEVLSTCRVYGPAGNLLASAQGSANNMEAKYRTQYLGDIKNTILKMSQKRAFVAAVLLATGASDLFTQDLEEEVADAHPAPHPQQAAPPRQSSQPSQPPSGNGEWGTSLSAAQVKAAHAAANSAGVPAEAAHAVVKAMSFAPKPDARAFMDELFSKDQNRILAAFAQHHTVSDPVPPPMDEPPIPNSPWD